MSTLADLPDLVGFFSYSREDDQDASPALSGLRKRIQRELRAQLGRSRTDFKLWQDREAIAYGAQWRLQITAAVAQSVFFIPIVTPTAIKSSHCKFELELFLAREAKLGRADLIFPILYIRVPALEDETQWPQHDILKVIGSRQYLDWQGLRHRDLESPDVGATIERFCRSIGAALQHTPSSGRQTADPQVQRTPTSTKRSSLRKSKAPSIRASLLPNELEPGSEHARTEGTKTLNDTEICFSLESRKDCKTLAVKVQIVRDFIAEEFIRHPAIFKRVFSSRPLIFRDHFVLLTWNGRTVSVERLVKQQADPSLESWVESLTIYRRATILPYRQNHDVLLQPRESARTIALFRRLVASATNFTRPATANARGGDTVMPLLLGHLEDADAALAEGDLVQAVIHLEMLLSSVHKLLLHHAPQAQHETHPDERIERATVLIVEDEQLIRMELQEILSKIGLLAFGVDSVEDALKELIDKRFEFIILDLNLGWDNGGRLVALAKRIDPEIKIVVVTAYDDLSRFAETVLVDAFLNKPFQPDDIIGAITTLRSGGVVPATSNGNGRAEES